MSKSIDEYTIGDELFRHVEGGGTFRYVVYGIRQYQGEVQLEVECQTCTHGWKCRLLLAQSDYGRIFHVHMLNEDEDEPQRNWHTNDGFHFWPTLAEAREEALSRVVRRMEESVATKESELRSLRQRLAELKAAASTEVHP